MNLEIKLKTEEQLKEHRAIAARKFGRGRTRIKMNRSVRSLSKRVFFSKSGGSWKKAATLAAIQRNRKGYIN